MFCQCIWGGGAAPSPPTPLHAFFLGLPPLQGQPTPTWNVSTSNWNHRKKINSQNKKKLIPKIFPHPIRKETSKAPHTNGFRDISKFLNSLFPVFFRSLKKKWKETLQKSYQPNKISKNSALSAFTRSSVYLNFPSSGVFKGESFIRWK